MLIFHIPFSNCLLKTMKRFLWCMMYSVMSYHNAKGVKEHSKTCINKALQMIVILSVFVCIWAYLIYLMINTFIGTHLLALASFSRLCLYVYSIIVNIHNWRVCVTMQHMNQYHNQDLTTLRWSFMWTDKRVLHRDKKRVLILITCSIVSFAFCSLHGSLYGYVCAICIMLTIDF